MGETSPQFCGKCGTPRSAIDDRFCRSCGANFVTDTAQAGGTPADKAPSAADVSAESVPSVPLCAKCGAERVGTRPYCVKCPTKWPDGTPPGPEQSSRKIVQASPPTAASANGSTAGGARSWWQSQMFVVLTMIFFFPVGLLLMWLYAPWRTRTKWIWSGVFAAFVALIIIGTVTGGEDKSEKSVSDKPTSAETASGVPTAERSEPTIAPPTPPPSWKEGEAMSYASVTKALGDGKEMSRSLDLGKASAGVDGDYITVTYKAGSAWSETDLLTIGAQTSFSAHRALFANPLVSSVTVIMLSDWTDQFGAKSEDVTTVSTLDRATVQRIDWSGLEDRVLLDNKHMFCISDAYRIHLGIYSRLGDTGCLTGAIRF